MRLLGKATAFAIAVAFAAPALVADPCTHAPQPSGLPVRDGHVTFMPAERLERFTAHRPVVGDPQVQAALESADTMWYDDEAMVFGYQDSVEFVVGFRANCVGRAIAERSRSHPQVGKLLQLFGEDFRFKFPFRTAAGTDRATNVHLVNFWLPPRDEAGRVRPVRWWKESSRGRWRWVFPVGTLFGEILYQADESGDLYPFEVRTRRRYLEGWHVNAYRPFATAEALASAVKNRRPDWESEPKLSQLVTHLEDPNTLVAHQLASEAYGRVFPPIDGALDRLPDFGDPSLVRELLTDVPFQSVEGMIWKENGERETYAPSSAAEFSIVPRDYELGLIAVNEDSCNRCHTETGRKLGYFISDVSLYGEIWGEDRIFTWHLFEPSERIYGPWDDNQGSRRVNARLTRAGLVEQGAPSAGDKIYKALPGPGH